MLNTFALGLYQRLIKLKELVEWQTIYQNISSQTRKLRCHFLRSHNLITCRWSNEYVAGKIV